MVIKAALLDERGVYLRIDELAGVESLTDRHLPQITSCDLLPAQYRWIPDERKNKEGEPVNPYGGAFWPLIWLKRVGLLDQPIAGLAERIESLKARK